MKLWATAEEYSLPPFTQGTRSQREYATILRDKALSYIWYQGWFGTQKAHKEAFDKLPTDTFWWLDNATESGRGKSAHDAVRRYLGLEYQTPAGADY